MKHLLSEIFIFVFLQLSAGEFKEAMETRAPRLMICSVEFVANEEVQSFSSKIVEHSSSKKCDIQVRSVLLDNRLAPLERRPVVAIDEAQVT